MSLPVVILAGGLATRLLPMTEKIPKSLLRVAGEYFINYQLRYLRQQGISQVVLCLGHLGDQIKTVVGNGSAYDLNVHYSWDGHYPLGTGGALRQALPLLGEEFFVLYGDSYLPINFKVVERDFFKSGKPALMTVFKNMNQGDKSNVLFNKDKIIEYNKRRPSPAMNYIDYGLSILSASLLKSLPKGQAFDLADLFHDLSLRDELAAHEVFEPFYEIGSKAGLNETIKYFSNIAKL
ncbi:mannose-1-phosphate guanylyltransferase [Legionella busanensis]|uniref:Mannose-1-phosphate guanylyltransferase n=1 Tax=Legionella busanensis TaxID=190655 RepID=A0A378JM37_9GAMM|nr:nucleotidyltransferase family protein [Legionella busanensis]STX52406.1 mannose-1-phosphate guanylyltransferase [Legionella busanensis]